MTVHVFQIGCQDIGRIGFEKLLEFEEYFPEDVIFEGIHCKDFEAERKAKVFAEAIEQKVEFFENIEELYSSADEVEGEVLIYDAGPSHLHSRNIGESLRKGFHHLTERPPSVKREEHVSERKLASNSSISYKVDFIERENPVVDKVKDLAPGKDIKKIEVFRESSFGVQKILQPVDFSHVKGGCVLDKMSNDIYILDLLDSAEFSLQDAEIEYFMPKNLGGEKVLRTDDSGSRKIDQETAIGKCKAKFSSKNTEIELNGSWLGVSDRVRGLNQRINDRFDGNLIRSDYREIDGKGFQDEECRFFIVKGETKLLADLLNQRIYDLEAEEEFEVPSYPRDQLYRTLERTVLSAAGITENSVDEEKIDRFMNGLFDIQANNEGELFEEIDEATKRIRSLMISDKKISDKANMQGVAR